MANGEDIARKSGPAWCTACGRPRSLTCIGCVEAARQVLAAQAVQAKAGAQRPKVSHG